MPVKHFVNRKTVESTDYKPNPKVLTDVFLIETDTGSFYNSLNGTSLKQLQGFDKPETITKKTINSEDNIIDTNAIIKYPFSNTYTIKGGVIPAADIPNSFYGVLEGGNLNNPDKVSIPIIDKGLMLQFTSNQANDIIGYNTPVAACERSDSYVYEGEIMSINNCSRVAFGFCSQPYFDQDYILNEFQSGIAVGYTKVETNFIVYCNNGDGLPISKTVLPLEKDNNLHYVKIELNSNNILVKLDNIIITLTNKTPLPDTSLFPISYGIN